MTSAPDIPTWTNFCGCLPDTIKIDKAFTGVIGTESAGATILPQILAMAESLNLEVVVEGVETYRQADYFLSGRAKDLRSGLALWTTGDGEEFPDAAGRRADDPYQRGSCKRIYNATRLFEDRESPDRLKRC